jgi:hypothetical protein
MEGCAYISIGRCRVITTLCFRDISFQASAGFFGLKLKRVSTGLTFGTISAIYGYSHGIVTQSQYSFLVAAVVASAVVPTLIAGHAFLPTHLLPSSKRRKEQEDALDEEG